MKLSKDDIKHIAQLARLELTAEEEKRYEKELSNVLNYIDQLQEVDTTNTEPTAQVTGLENILREDEKNDWNKKEREQTLKQAPNLKDNQYKVKRVLE